MFQQYYTILLLIVATNYCLPTLSMPTVGGYAQEQQVANDPNYQLPMAGKGLGKLDQVETLSKLLGALERSAERNSDDIRIVQVDTQTSKPTDEDEQVSNSKYAAKRKSLTKKWHKVVDELIDEELSENNKYPNKNKLEKPTKKKRWMSGGANDAEKLTIIMKKPIDLEESTKELADGLSGTNLMNSGLWVQDQAAGGNNRRRETTESQRNLNTNDHTRRVLNDQFGIMKESKFTTNNHLGLKGVPKFGSDDEY